MKNRRAKVICASLSVLTITAAASGAASAANKCGGDTVAVANVATELLVRGSASATGEVVGYLKGGSGVLVESMNDEWTKVTSGSVSGYVKTECLAFDEKAKELLEVYGEQGAVAAWDDVKIFSNPEDTSSVIGTIDEGEGFLVVGSTANWVEVELDNGTIAYIPTEDVKLTKVVDTAVGPNDTVSTGTKASSAAASTTAAAAAETTTATAAPAAETTAAAETAAPAAETTTAETEAYAENTASGTEEYVAVTEGYAEETAAETEYYAEETTAETDYYAEETTAETEYYAEETTAETEYYVEETTAETEAYVEETESYVEETESYVEETTAETESYVEETPVETEAADTSSDSTSDTASDVSDSDVELLAALIYCEAGNQSLEGKTAVGQVVMNRVSSSSFADSISGVIYESGQFSVASSGWLDSVKGTDEVTDECYEAAVAAINGEDVVGDALYFNTGSGSGTKIGDHQFY